MPFKNILDKKNYEKDYYETHKDEICLKNKEKYKCECGIELTLHSKSRHDKSKQHINFFDPIMNTNYTCECGKELLKCNKEKHEKSKTHNDFLNKGLCFTCECGTMLSLQYKLKHLKTKRHIESLELKLKKSCNS